MVAAQGDHHLDRAHDVGPAQPAENLRVLRPGVGQPVEPQRCHGWLEGNGESGDVAVWIGQEHEREQVGLVAELMPLEVERLVVAVSQADVQRAQARPESAAVAGDGERAVAGMLAPPCRVT